MPSRMVAVLGVASLLGLRYHLTCPPPSPWIQSIPLRGNWELPDGGFVPRFPMHTLTPGFSCGGPRARELVVICGLPRGPMGLRWPPPPPYRSRHTRLGWLVGWLGDACTRDPHPGWVPCPQCGTGSRRCRTCSSASSRPRRLPRTWAARPTAAAPGPPLRGLARGSGGGEPPVSQGGVVQNKNGPGPRSSSPPAPPATTAAASSVSPPMTPVQAPPPPHPAQGRAVGLERVGRASPHRVGER